MSGKITKSKNSFTAIPNAMLHNKELSWKARGLLCYLLSLSPEWTIYKKDLKNRAPDGYDSMISAFNELMNAGYIDESINREGGMFSSVDYIIYDSPIREKPESVKPESENPQLLNNSLSIYKKENVKKSKKERAEDFRLSLLPFLKTDQNKEGKSREFLRNFFDYWTETSDTTTLLRFEGERYFDIKRRMSTFTQKENPANRFGSKPSSPVNGYSPVETN